RELSHAHRRPLKGSFRALPPDAGRRRTCAQYDKGRFLQRQTALLSSDQAEYRRLHEREAFDTGQPTSSTCKSRSRVSVELWVPDQGTRVRLNRRPYSTPLSPHL